jgi:hypothetical protein
LLNAAAAIFHVLPAGNMVGPGIDWSKQVMPASASPTAAAVPKPAAVLKPGMGSLLAELPFLGNRGTCECGCLGTAATLLVPCVAALLSHTSAALFVPAVGAASELLNMFFAPSKSSSKLRPLHMRRYSLLNLFMPPTLLPPITLHCRLCTAGGVI